jgi:hypothetical protein
MSEPTPPSVKIFKASTELQVKAGTGEVDEKKIVRAENVIQNNTEDFLPLAVAFLNRLDQGITNARKPGLSMEAKIAGMTQPVMELKANARMFKYDLVTVMANVMLGFLETIKELDDDAIEIVAAHHTTLRAIIAKQIKGDGGSIGVRLRTELEDACARYFKKRSPV